MPENVVETILESVLAPGFEKLLKFGPFGAVFLVQQYDLCVLWLGPLLLFKQTTDNPPSLTTLLGASSIDLLCNMAPIMVLLFNTKFFQL